MRCWGVKVILVNPASVKTKLWDTIIRAATRIWESASPELKAAYGTPCQTCRGHVIAHNIHAGKEFWDHYVKGMLASRIARSCDPSVAVCSLSICISISLGLYRVLQ